MSESAQSNSPLVSYVRLVPMKPKKSSKSKPKPKPKMGRPSKQAEINRTVFEGLCRIVCTEIEVCSVLGISQPTLWRWCQATYGHTFEYVHKKFSSEGKASLRRAQLKLALGGNATMLIWLGKTLLGQKEPRMEIDLKTDVTKLTDEQLDTIVAAQGISGAGATEAPGE